MNSGDQTDTGMFVSLLFALLDLRSGALGTQQRRAPLALSASVPMAR